MALHLQKAVIRNSAVNMALCLALAIGIGLMAGAAVPEGAGLAWPLALAAGIGLFSGWRMLSRIKDGVLQPLSRPLSYVALARDADGTSAGLDWRSIDLYAEQLATRGFRRLGDYAPYPPPQHAACIAACFVDAAQSTLVEVQAVQVHGNAPDAVNADIDGIHFSIASVVGGTVRVTTTDHRPMAANYLMRGDNDVVASYPGMGLFALLVKHEQLLAALHARTGKSPSPGLTMARYILLQREGMAQARARLARRGGYRIARQIDAFEANPLRQWAPPSARLAVLPERSLDALDDVPADGQPLIVDAATAAEAGPAGMHGDAHADAHADALRAKAAGAANWFYWIAALSLVNAAVDALGSDWAFAIGLGLSQLFSGLAGDIDGSGGSFGTVVLWHAASAAVAAFFAACGWYARRVSTMAFATGMLVFAIDALLFVLAADWIGVAFHVLALCCIWPGFAAARRLRKRALA